MQAWFAEHGHTDDGIRQTMSAKAVQFVDSLVRQERPAVQSRMNKQKQVQQKPEQAVLEAKSKWESMDVKDVLSPALFELAKLGGSRRKPITLNDDSALAFLAQNNAELMEKHKLKIVPASSSKQTSIKRTPAPKRAAEETGEGQEAPAIQREIQFRVAAWEPSAVISFFWSLECTWRLLRKAGAFC